MVAPQTSRKVSKCLRKTRFSVNGRCMHKSNKFAVSKSRVTITALLLNADCLWFGPQDLISLDQIKQAGSAGVVSALHHIYGTQAWPL
jgi:hypothetical protein